MYEAVERLLPVTQFPAFLIALAGTVGFYGLERLARSSTALEREGSAQERHRTPSFWIHLASFAVYNAMIGYLLLHRAERENVLNIVLFKEELPEERKSRFWAFLLGAAFYTVLLLSV